VTRGTRTLGTALAASVVLGMLTVAPVSALPFDGVNPGTHECGQPSQHTVYILDTAYINASNGARIGRVELRHSAYCATVWTRVYNETNQVVSSREKLTTYETPNLAGSTTYTESDTLQPEGQTGDSGWGMMYRDRPAFRARGEILWQGVWRYAQTEISAGWNQFDGNYPNYSSSPRSCDETPGDYCKRWTTTNAGGPATVYFAFDLPGLSVLDSSPTTEWEDVLEAWEDLSGLSPNFTEVSVGNQHYRITAYTGIATDNRYAYTIHTVRATQPYFYTSATTYINATKNPGSPPWEYLACPEIAHVVGLLDIDNSDVLGSKATCVGAERNIPGHDDQAAMTKIYSTPIAGE
jgi:hypothetical protein